MSARLPLFKNRGSSRGAKKGNRVRQGVQKLAFVQRSACNSKQPINPATETRRLTNSSSRRSDARLPSPRPPGRRRRPALWHPASACLLTPPAPLAPFSARLRATPFLPARLNRLDDTHHPAHSPLASALAHATPHTRPAPEETLPSAPPRLRCTPGARRSEVPLALPPREAAPLSSP